jgi:hypothetical protein
MGKENRMGNMGSLSLGHCYKPTFSTVDKCIDPLKLHRFLLYDRTGSLWDIKGACKLLFC